jgi:hypothetical protein
VQRVASRGFLVTPIATPAESALDNEPAVSDFEEDANRTDSITHDDVDERVHNEASLITNELQIDDLLLGLGIQLPHSPKTKATLSV